MHKKFRISSHLILSSVALIALTMVLMVLAHHANQSLRNDAYIINAAGIVRGSIQRLSKLHLEGCDQVCDDISKTIDSRLKEISGLAWEEDTSGPDSFKDRISRLSSVWEELHNLLLEYQQHPTPQLKSKISKLSEYAWETADSAVLFAQLSSESKLGSLKLLYPVAAMIVFINIAIIIIAYSDVGQRLEHMATVDNLTEVYNRHAFMQLLDDEMQKSRRYKQNCSLLIFDVDHFKNINDRYGHQAGDKTLLSLCQLAKSIVRKVDHVARIGGEEFAIIAPEADIDGAMSLAEKLRDAIASHHFAGVGRVTVSVGVAHYVQGASLEEWISQGDIALYEAKQRGRNRISMFPHDQANPQFSKLSH